LKLIPDKTSLYETVLISVNDYLVFKFLDKKISFNKMMTLINKFSNIKEFKKYKKITPKNVNDIYRLRDYVSLKLNALGI
jgi:1-deoxy-D-xylulose-5-phosphate reductoisomerase